MDEIQAHFDKVASFSEEERRNYFRLDDNRQFDFADFLDYLDEWKWNYDEILKRVRIDFLRSFYLKPNLTFDCIDHVHIFVDRACDVVSDLHLNINTLNFGSCPCVFRKINSTAFDVAGQNLFQDTTRNTAIGAVYFYKLVQRELRANNFPELPPTVEEFERLWMRQTNSQSVSTASGPTVANLPVESDSPLVCTIAETISKVDASMPASLVIPGPVREPEVCVTDVSTFYSDHGLHCLLRTADQEFMSGGDSSILRVVNDIRVSAGGTRFLPGRVRRAMRSCKACGAADNVFRILPDVCGILYAPPGSGKTHAMSNEFIVGVDTDWLVRYSTFNHVIKPFIDLGLCVITNQYDLCENSGVKVFCYFNEAHVKPDNLGNPLTNYEAFARFVNRFPDNYVIYHDRCPAAYLSDRMCQINLLRFAFIKFVEAQNSVILNYRRYSQLKKKMRKKSYIKTIARIFKPKFPDGVRF